MQWGAFSFNETMYIALLNIQQQSQNYHDLLKICLLPVRNLEVMENEKFQHGKVSVHICYLTIMSNTEQVSTEDWLASNDLNPMEHF